MIACYQTPPPPSSPEIYRQALEDNPYVVFGYPGIILTAAATVIAAFAFSLWILLFFVPISVWAVYVRSEARENRYRKDDAIQLLKEKVTMSGIYEFPDKEDVVSELRDLVFEGKPGEIIRLADVETKRWEKIYETLDFVRKVYGDSEHYEYPGGYRQNEVEEPILDALNKRCDFHLAEGYINSVDLMEKLWQNSNADERRCWTTIVKKDLQHLIHVVFPKRKFADFVASKVGK